MQDDCSQFKQYISFDKELETFIEVTFYTKLDSHSQVIICFFVLTYGATNQLVTLIALWMVFCSNPRLRL